MSYYTDTIDSAVTVRIYVAYGMSKALDYIGVGMGVGSPPSTIFDSCYNWLWIISTAYKTQMVYSLMYLT